MRQASKDSTTAAGRPLRVPDRTFLGKRRAEAVRLGVCGLVPPASSTSNLLACLTAVMRGELWLTRQVLAELVRRTSPAGPLDTRTRMPAGTDLTARQRDVLRLLLLGCGNKDISKRLGVSPQTVKHHLTAILEKTALHSRLELALFAAQHLPDVEQDRASARDRPQRRLDPDLR